MLKFINHYIILFFLLSAPLGALAQDWALFPEGHKGYYRGGFGEDYGDIRNTVGVLIADSIEQKGDTTIYRLNYNQPIYGSNCKSRSLRNDFIPEAARQNFFHIEPVFAMTPDFIPIKVAGDTSYIGDFRFANFAGAGESWQAADSVVCRVDSIVWTELGGAEDSVKYITLTNADTSLQMKLSKSNGLLDFRPGLLHLFFAEDLEVFGRLQQYEKIGGTTGEDSWGFQTMNFKKFFEHWRPGNVFYYETWSSADVSDHRYEFYKDSVTARTETEDTIIITYDRSWRKKVRGVDTAFKQIGRKQGYGQFFRLVEPSQFIVIPDSNLEYGSSCNYSAGST